MDCAMLLRSYSRYMLILFNVIFVITGIIIISVGISAKAYFHEFDQLMDHKYFLISDLLIVIGVVIFFIAFFGCCGAMKENACMTNTYSTLLIIIFILELAVGIAGVVLNSKTEGYLKDTLERSMQEYNNASFNETTLVWDTIQTKFQCCGVESKSEWLNMTSTNHSIPASCCKLPPGSIEYVCHPGDAYPEGCLVKFGDFVSDNITYIEGVGIGLAIVQLLGIIFSCCLAKFIRSDYETV